MNRVSGFKVGPEYLATAPGRNDVSFVCHGMVAGDTKLSFTINGKAVISDRVPDILLGREYIRKDGRPDD